jgi:hypothetical protein
MKKTTITLERPAESKLEQTIFQKRASKLELPPVKTLSWFERVLCRGLGIHRGKWAYMAESECRQITVCHRCGKTRVRTKHQRKWVYIAAPRKHWPERTCSLCGKSFVGPSMMQWHQQSTHGINPTIPGDHDICEQQRICQRCGEAWEGFRIRHEWGPSYKVSASTDGHTCLRCGEKESWCTSEND